VGKAGYAYGVESMVGLVREEEGKGGRTRCGSSRFGRPEFRRLWCLRLSWHPRLLSTTIERRVNFDDDEVRRRKVKRTLYAESKNTDVSFRMAALLNAGVRALRCLCAT